MQINLKLDCTLYTGLGVHFYRNIQLIKKILKVDYPRGKAKGYFANFISAKKLKIEFSLFHPTVSHSTDISPVIQGIIY